MFGMDGSSGMMAPLEKMLAGPLEDFKKILTDTRDAWSSADKRLDLLDSKFDSRFTALESHLADIAAKVDSFLESAAKSVVSEVKKDV